MGNKPNDAAREPRLSPSIKDLAAKAKQAAVKAQGTVLKAGDKNGNGKIDAEDFGITKESMPHRSSKPVQTALEKASMMQRQSLTAGYCVLFSKRTCIRKMDGLCSNITYMYVTVDTVAPQISFNNEFETYEEGIYLHGICSKDTIEVWLDGEYVYMSDVPDFGIYFELTPGEHKMVFELYDRCGNKTTEEIVLQRYVN